MTSGIAAPLLTLSLLSVSQLMTCGKSPKDDYKRFAHHAEKGKCKSVYNDLSTDSKARLDAYLQVMRDMALKAYDVEHPPPEAPPIVDVPDGGVADAAVGEATSTGDETEEEGGEAKPEPEPSKPDYRELREMTGKDLFVSLCRGKPKDLPTLYREAGLAEFSPLSVKYEEKDEKGDGARVYEKKTKKSKKKKGKEESEEAADYGVEMILERGHYRVVLAPMGIEWNISDDGRLLPKFRSPILTVGGDTDAKRTPTYDYNRIVAHLQEGRCEAFYAGLDSASRARIEVTVPMMIGFASIIASDEPKPDSGENRGKALVVALCKKASPSELTATGLHLGEVLEEKIRGTRASLTIRTKEKGKSEGNADSPTHEVMMVRENGSWHLSIDAFSDLLGNDDEEEEEGDEDSEEEEDEEEEGD